MWSHSAPRAFPLWSTIDHSLSPATFCHLAQAFRPVTCCLQVHLCTVKVAMMPSARWFKQNLLKMLFNNLFLCDLFKKYHMYLPMRQLCYLVTLMSFYSPLKWHAINYATVWSINSEDAANWDRLQTWLILMSLASFPPSSFLVIFTNIMASICSAASSLYSQ